jgi:hypothetical protein
MNNLLVSILASTLGFVLPASTLFAQEHAPTPSAAAGMPESTPSNETTVTISTTPTPTTTTLLPSPLDFGIVNIGTSAAAIVTVTNNGTSNQTLSSPYFTITGSDDFTIPGVNTSFPTVQNPISESGRWINGLDAGLQWSNVQVLGGPDHVTGTTVNNPPPYNDSTAALTGTWPQDQTVCGVVYNAGFTATTPHHEIELRLNTAITANMITGYEFNLSVSSDGSQYAQIVRWNGPVNNFTPLASAQSPPGLHNGDTVFASRIGGTLTLTQNGNVLVTTSDSTYLAGSPGVGFWNRGSIGDYASFGFSSFGTNTCLDGTVLAANGGTCTFGVLFTPTVDASETATLTVLGTTVSLTGFGQPAPEVTVTPTTISFGRQKLNTTTPPQTVALVNNSAGTIELSSTPAVGPQSQFAISANTCGTAGSTIASGATCSVSVTFRPTSTGTKSGTLTFGYTGDTGSPLTVSLLGSGSHH